MIVPEGNSLISKIIFKLPFGGIVFYVFRIDGTATVGKDQETEIYPEFSMHDNEGTDGLVSINKSKYYF